MCSGLLESKACDLPLPSCLKLGLNSFSVVLGSSLGQSDSRCAHGLHFCLSVPRALGRLLFLEHSSEFIWMEWSPSVEDLALLGHGKRHMGHDTP